MRTGTLRLALASLLATALLLPAARDAAAQGKRFEGVTLRVATWGGPWRDSQANIISKKFEELGGKIEFVTGSPQANLAKVIAARGNLPFDIMEILDAQVGDFIEGKLIEPVDLAKIPNKEFVQSFQYNKNMVGTWVTQEVICYNTAKYKELGLAPPKTYKDLADPKLGRKVSIPDINSGGGLSAVGAFAFAAGGDEKNVQPGLDLVKTIQPLKFWAAGGEVVTQFQTGDIIAAVAHAGWCHRALNAGAPVAAVHPEIKPGVKGVLKEGWFVILKGTKLKEAAHWYLNEFLDPNFQYDFAVVSGVVPISKPALARVGQVAGMGQMIFSTPEEIATMLRIDYTKADLSKWSDAWNRTVTK